MHDRLVGGTGLIEPAQVFKPVVQKLVQYGLFLHLSDPILHIDSLPVFDLCFGHGLFSGIAIVRIEFNNSYGLPFFAAFFLDRHFNAVRLVRLLEVDHPFLLCP